MRKILLLLFVVSVFSSVRAQQWYVGVPVNDSITYRTINSYSFCYPASNDVLVFPVSNVTGVVYAMIFDSVSIANSIYTSQTGIINQGDTLYFTFTYPSYDFYYPAGGTLHYTIKAIGTPQTAGQIYPCDSLMWVCTTSLCPYGCQYSFSNQCTTQVAGSVYSINFASEFTLFPNPALNNLQLAIRTLQNQKSELEIFDALGKSIYKSVIHKSQEEINVSTFPAGVYFLHLKSEKGTAVKKFVKM